MNDAPDWVNGIVHASANLDADAIALRNKYVDEYLKDYDAVASALRCGFCHELAREYANNFMTDNYVQWRISKLTYDNNNSPEEDDLDTTERQVFEALKREAFYTGPGSSQNARVSALKVLSDKVEKMKALKGNGNKVNSGVMVVPAEVSAEQWEAQAVDMQEKLKQDTLNDI